ncbi:hypothetical protein M3Y98_00728200 [Aphelenchoides besseyi]|nr:hypothetical protein M3Y98_00728200 [Aphelenchoides besseyi]KAI6211342.1 hypothetical protein M3Y96_00423800 [Aphelenchoides besseyi]
MSSTANLPSLLFSSQTLNRRSKLARDQYRPEKVEQNLQTGLWTLAPNIKRYGFVEILEKGEKIGLVKCAYCSVTCSRNSFKKVKSHFYEEHNQDGGGTLLPVRKKLNASNGLNSTDDYTLLNDDDDQLDDSPLLHDNSGHNKLTGTDLEQLSIEQILSRLTSGLPLPEHETDEMDKEVDFDSFPSSHNSPVVVYQTTPAIQRVQSPSQSAQPRGDFPSSTQKSRVSSAAVNDSPSSGTPCSTTANSVSGNRKPLSPRSNSPALTQTSGSRNEDDSLGVLVNSTYRTISSQNRRLAIEFKCSLMKLMAEFEMRMLDTEQNNRS